MEPRAPFGWQGFRRGFRVGVALGTAIFVYGLAFATVLTLVIIPSLLMLVTRADNPKPWVWQRQKRRDWYATHRPARGGRAQPAE